MKLSGRIFPTCRFAFWWSFEIKRIESDQATTSEGAENE